MPKPNEKADPATCKHPNIKVSGQTCEICGTVVILACKDCGVTEGVKMYDSLVTADPTTSGQEQRSAYCDAHKPSSNSAQLGSH